MLIVTNGDSAVSALKEAGIRGHIFPWRDMLHEGPVPQGLSLSEMSDVRARYIASIGGGSEQRVRQDFKLRDEKLASARHQRELVLWFEHDLYDQLQLLQLLWQLAADPPEDTNLSLVCHDTFITHAPAELLGEWFEDRAPLDEDQITLGHQAWEAFSDPSPESWADLLDADTGALPFLADAVERHLEEFPGPGDGLSRTERQILQALAEGHDSPGALFRAVHDMEEAAFMGDSSFWRILAGMTAEAPLIRPPTGEFQEPRGPRPEPGFLRQSLDFTTLGDEVLARTTDWLARRKVDKWLGGVHLEGPPVWRWDPGARQLLTS